MSPASKNQQLPVKKLTFSSAFLPNQLATAKYNKQSSKVVTKSIDIMALNIAMVTRTLDFVWTSYIGLQMLTGSLPEKIYPESSHIVRLGNH